MSAFISSARSWAAPNTGNKGFGTKELTNITAYRAKFLWLGIWLGILISSSGCLHWRKVFRHQNAEESQGILQPPRMSPDSVVLEISIITIPKSQISGIDDLFHRLDLSRIDLAARKNLDRNGIRVAAGGIELPLEYERLLAVEKKDELATGDPGEIKQAPRRRIQARSGKPFRIATTSIQPELSWVEIDADGYRHGGSRPEAQPEFEALSFAEGDGGVRLLLQPRVLYGEPQQKVTMASSSLRYEMKRAEIRFPQLEIPVRLMLGESLLMTASLSGQQSGPDGVQFGVPNDGPATENDVDDSRGERALQVEPFGLGQAFFEDPQGNLKLVVIRLAQSQKDNSFDSSGIHQPLESITDQLCP